MNLQSPVMFALVNKDAKGEAVSGDEKLRLLNHIGAIPGVKLVKLANNNLEKGLGWFTFNQGITQGRIQEVIHYLESLEGIQKVSIV